MREPVPHDLLVHLLVLGDLAHALHVEVDQRHAPHQQSHRPRARASALPRHGHQAARAWRQAARQQRLRVLGVVAPAAVAVRRGHGQECARRGPGGRRLTHQPVGQRRRRRRVCVRRGGVWLEALQGDHDGAVFGLPRAWHSRGSVPRDAQALPATHAVCSSRGRPHRLRDEEVAQRLVLLLGREAQQAAARGGGFGAVLLLLCDGGGGGRQERAEEEQGALVAHLVQRLRGAHALQHALRREH
eukprot:scaffold801_cov296-Prasinococcus_capsulatus_cf.AAC.1